MKVTFIDMYVTEAWAALVGLRDCFSEWFSPFSSVDCPSFIAASKAAANKRLVTEPMQSYEWETGSND